jgi:DNA-binding NtrC family response regulator
VADGDLHAALGTVLIALPPLRARRGELPVLVERLLERARAGDDAAGESPGSTRRHATVLGLTPAAREVIERYPWPGNLRELYTVLTGARLRAHGERIDAADLPAYVRLAVRLEEIPGPAPERPLPLDHLLEQAERRLIALALRLARGNRSRAAELLSIWRPRLQRRMEALGLDAGS